jgi:thioredoxin-like negative regulator of GroEL
MRLLLATLIAAAALEAAAAELWVFTRPGCGPCEALKATLKADPSLAAGYEVYLVDVKEQPRLATKHGVKAVPVLVLFSEGKECGRRVGYANKEELADWLRMKSRRIKK